MLPFGSIAFHVVALHYKIQDGKLGPLYAVLDVSMCDNKQQRKKLILTLSCFNYFYHL